ncbi:hypothetical protein BGZ83_005165, partial [Gryganskiella cystojenkinii]
SILYHTALLFHSAYFYYRCNTNLLFFSTTTKTQQVSSICGTVQEQTRESFNLFWYPTRDHCHCSFAHCLFCTGRDWRQDPFPRVCDGRRQQVCWTRGEILWLEHGGSRRCQDDVEHGYILCRCQ